MTPQCYARAMYNRGQAPRMNSGQAVILPILVVLLIAFTLAGRAARPALRDTQLARELQGSKRAGALADAGAEDISYRIRKAMQYGVVEYVPLGDFFAITTVSTNPDGSQKTVSGLGSDGSNTRQKTTNLTKGDQVDFNYAVQAGNGGFTMANTSSIKGNLYSNGPVVGLNSTKIYGSVVSAGPTGLINGVHSTSTGYAHTITSATLDGSAYYQRISGSTVHGSLCPNFYCYPGNPDKPTTTVTIGPMKIPCNMEISNNATVTFAGMVWVVGNISFKNSNSIKLDPALGAKSIAIIADDPANRTTGSTVSIANSTTFQNSGVKGSFFFLISGNTSSESGGGTTAIDLSNSATGPVVLYSNHGKISLGNNSQLKSVTGHLISMSNSAQLIYDDGLESALFDTGPGGSWNVVNWKEK